MSGSETLQARIVAWLLACFGEEIARDKTERNHRFLEESLELAQAAGCSLEEAFQLALYVYGRPKGTVGEEVGGVMNTLMSLCHAHDLDCIDLAEAELVRVWQNLAKIREKQAAKPKFSPLPEASEGGNPLVPALSMMSEGYLEQRRLCAEKSRALTAAAEQFRHYARLHKAKGTPEADDKAAENVRMAELCEEANGVSEYEEIGEAGSHG